MIWRSGDRVTFAKSVALISTIALLSELGAGCSKITYGELPLRVSAISGIVVGNAKYEDASKPRGRLGGVRVQLLRRTDTKYSKDVVAKKIRNALEPGMVAEWKCTDVVTSTSSDESGQFMLRTVEPGTYCLDFEGAEYDARNHTRMGERFLIDVERGAEYRAVTADITPLWADCKGGGKIEYEKSSSKH